MQRIIRLLLEAAQLEGGDPPTALFVRSAKVLRRALEAGGDWSAACRRSLADEGVEYSPAVERYYDILVRLVHGVSSHVEPLVEGEGNFGGVCYGHPDYPPAHPRYTACKITARGLQYLADTA